MDNVQYNRRLLNIPTCYWLYNYSWLIERISVTFYQRNPSYYLVKCKLIRDKGKQCVLKWRKWSKVENKIVGPLNLVRFKGNNAGKQVWLFISRVGETHGPECNVNREQTSIYAWAYKSRRCPSSTTKLWPKGTSCALRNACTSSISLAFSYFYLFEVRSYWVDS